MSLIDCCLWLTFPLVVIFSSCFLVLLALFTFPNFVASFHPRPNVLCNNLKLLFGARQKKEIYFYTPHARKMTNNMTMQEQIIMSGLAIMSSLSSSSSSLSSSSVSQLQWNPINQWSPLLGGGRQGPACVIVSGNGAHPYENDAAGQTIVVLGGRMRSIGCTSSVVIWDPSTMEWRHGPNLSVNRKYFVAVVCRDKVYAIGGDDNDDGDYTVSDTMESIQVSSLLETETSTTRQNNSQWTRLQCRLLSPRVGCAAVVVHNRYVVILGGYTTGRNYLSSVDILDTAPHNNNGEPTIVAGPSMNSARGVFGAAVMDNRIFVVGGQGNGGRLSSVEYLMFHQQLQDKDHTNNNSDASSTFPNSLWMVEPCLTLSTGRSSHAVTKVGSCLVVAGGFARGGTLTYNSVEVLDVKRRIVWSLPNLTIPREAACSMVTLSDCLLVLGGNFSVDSVESLGLTAYRKHDRCYKFLKFLIEIELLGRPTRN